MTDVTGTGSEGLVANRLVRADGNVFAVEEECPDCGGEDIGCPFGDWSWGDVDVDSEHE